MFCLTDKRQWVLEIKLYESKMKKTKSQKDFKKITDQVLEHYYF